jgi:hypothetical protein
VAQPSQRSFKTFRKFAPEMPVDDDAAASSCGDKDDAAHFKPVVQPLRVQWLILPKPPSPHKNPMLQSMACRE